MFCDHKGKKKKKEEKVSEKTCSHTKNHKWKEKEHCYASVTTVSSMDGGRLEMMQEPSRGHSHCWALGTSLMTEKIKEKIKRNEVSRDVNSFWLSIDSGFFLVHGGKCAKQLITLYLARRAMVFPDG